MSKKMFLEMKSIYMPVVEKTRNYLDGNEALEVAGYNSVQIYLFSRELMDGTFDEG